MRLRSVGLPELIVFVITWVVCFALVACVIYLVDASRPPERKIGMWKARIPSLIIALAVFFFRYLLP